MRNEPGEGLVFWRQGRTFGSHTGLDGHQGQFFVWDKRVHTKIMPYCGAHYQPCRKGRGCSLTSPGRGHSRI
jgi:hypothetical protein